MRGAEPDDPAGHAGVPAHCLTAPQVTCPPLQSDFCTCIPEEHDHGMGKLTVRAGLPGATIFAPVPRAPALDLCPGRLATTDAQ